MIFKQGNLNGVFIFTQPGCMLLMEEKVLPHLRSGHATAAQCHCEMALQALSTCQVCSDESDALHKADPYFGLERLEKYGLLLVSVVAPQ